MEAAVEAFCDRLRAFETPGTASRSSKPAPSTPLRLGFRYEGLFLNHLIVKGRSCDTARFSLTDEEWPAVRDAQARRFAPENFDAEGRQRVSLSELTRALW